MAVSGNCEFWREFFEIYRSLPETWQIKSEEYKNKTKKNKAYLILLDKFKEIEPNANVDSLKKKINTIRTSFRRELKKKRQSERSGSGAEELYIPSLWYFNDLVFLMDQEDIIDGVSSMDDEFEINPRSETEESSIVNTTKKKVNVQGERNELLRKAISHLDNRKKEPDEADTLCASWAVRFRKLDAQQQLFANKTIEEVLYRAALGNLNENSYKCLETPPERPHFLSRDFPSSSSNYSARASTPLSNYTSSPLSYDESSRDTMSPKIISNHSKPVRISGLKKPYILHVLPKHQTTSINEQQIQQNVRYYPNTTNIEEDNENFHDENNYQSENYHYEEYQPPKKVYKYASVKDLFMDKDFS